jgi:multicomponent Na+:H+ antiporter subunit B
MMSSSDSPIVVLMSRFLAPFIQLFALYVVFHGHYSPGGGFQGGAMLAASILLLRLAIGNDRAQIQFASSWNTPLSSFGVFIYAGVGLAALGLGGEYLNYRFLEFPGFEAAARRSLGILLVELGVALAVMGTLVSIFDDIVDSNS